MSEENGNHLEVAIIVIPQVIHFFFFGNGREFHDGRIACTRDTGETLSTDGHITIRMVGSFGVIILHKTIQFKGCLEGWNLSRIRVRLGIG